MNYRAHVRRWEGLSAWWRGLFGLRTANHESHKEDVDHSLLSELPAPDEARGELEQAAEHFLRNWLIEKDIAVATGYFDERTHPCVHMPDGRLAPDHRTARLELYRELRAASAIVGPIAGLDEAMIRTEPWLGGLKLLTADEDRPYLLFDASNDTWHALDCSRKGHPAHFVEAREEKNLYKDARGVAFTLTDPEGSGLRVHQIWKKLGGRWRIIAFERDFESAAELGHVSASRWQPEAGARKEIEGDRELIRTARRFYRQWLVRQRIDAALKYVDAEAFSCWSAPGEAPVSGNQALQDVERGLKFIADNIGRHKRLEDVIGSVDPWWYRQAGFVRHDHQELFDVLAGQREIVHQHFQCGDAGFEGEHFTTCTQLQGPRTSHAVLLLRWAKRNGDWRIVAARTETH